MTVIRFDHWKEFVLSSSFSLTVNVINYRESWWPCLTVINYNYNNYLK